MRKALELGIEKFNAFNISEKDRQAVTFYIEGDEQSTEEFKNFSNSNFPVNAEVSEVYFEDYTGYVTGIVDYMHLLQVEQLDKGIPAILNIENIQYSMLEKQDTMLDKQDKMLEKQDTTIDILGSVKEDTSAMRDDISTVRKDTRDVLIEKYELLSREITDIKADISEIKAKIM